MGQRHQLFAAARINGTYRVLAVVHHQWLLGYDVIKRCHSIMKLFRTNAEGIKREIKRAEGLDWARDVPKDKQITSGPIFPFIATTLFLGTANGGQDGDGAFVYLLSINTTIDDCINDDGFTIFDISDPDKPRFAFVFDAKLIGPWEYFEPYASQQHVNLACREKMARLECSPKVGLEVVKGLWPRIKWRDSEAFRASREVEGGLDSLLAKNDHVDSDETAPKSKDPTLAKVVDEALTAPEDSENWMSHATQLKDFGSTLRARIFENPSRLHHKPKAKLLQVAFADADVVDLRRVDDLKADELLAIFRSTSISIRDLTKSLLLPDMADLTADKLTELLSIAPIKSLDLGMTAPIELADLLKLIAASKVQHFCCPALYKRAFDIKVTDSMKGMEGAGGICQLAIPSTIFPTGSSDSFPLVQFVYIRQYRSGSHPRLQSGGLNWERVLHALDTEVNLGGTNGRKEDDKAPKVLVMPLQDTLLPAESVAEAMPRLLRQCLELKGEDLKPGFGKAVHATALTLSMGLPDDNKTSPIPAEALASWKTYSSSTDNVGPEIQTKVPGWTLLVFHECISPTDVATFGRKQQPEIRYAFYTTQDNGSTRVVTADGFFSATTTDTQAGMLKEKWQTSMTRLEKYYADPMDEQRRGHHQEGKVLAASAAEVHGGLKLVKCYNEQVRKGAEERRKAREREG